MKLFPVAKDLEFFFLLGKVYIVIVGTGDSWRPKYGQIITNYQAAKQLMESFYVYYVGSETWYAFPRHYSTQAHNHEWHYILDCQGNVTGKGGYIIPNDNEYNELKSAVKYTKNAKSKPQNVNDDIDSFEMLYKNYSIDNGRCSIIPTWLLKDSFKQKGYICLKHLSDKNGHGRTLYIKVPQDQSDLLIDRYSLHVPAYIIKQISRPQLIFLRNLFWDNGFTRLKEIILKPA